MYTQDADESFPYTYVPGSTNGHYTGVAGPYQWYDATEPYTHNWDIDICPEIKNIEPGYGMNAALSGQSEGTMYDPVKKVLIIDFADPTRLGGRHGQCEVNSPPTYPMVDDPLLANTYAQRHNEGYNVGYGDGHAKWARADALRDPLYWDPRVRQP
jgi:prepilin-type processing-associated H-X9-DG protein